MIPADAPPATDFIREIIDDDLKTHKHLDRVATRFPPEPNGYLHIGHAKSVCLNFGIALQYGGTCNLRLDDTDPSGESLEFVQSIITDVHWLGFDWADRLFYASDYFEQLYGFAVMLIKAGKAYVCSLSADEIREYRGTLTEPGRKAHTGCVRWRRASTFFIGCVKGNSRTARTCCGRGSIWPPRTWSCAIPSSTV